MHFFLNSVGRTDNKWIWSYGGIEDFSWARGISGARIDRVGVAANNEE